MPDKRPRIDVDDAQAVKAAACDASAAGACIAVFNERLSLLAHTSPAKRVAATAGRRQLTEISHAAVQLEVAISHVLGRLEPRATPQMSTIADLARTRTHRALAIRWPTVSLMRDVAEQGREVG